MGRYQESSLTKHIKHITASASPDNKGGRNTIQHRGWTSSPAMNTNTKSDAELAAASCGCPHKCQRFELLPLDQGIMITLHLPSSSSSSSSTSNTGDSNNDVQKAIDESPKHPCTCLKLHPQQDANLSQFHPNIYIPASLLDYPEHLVKHGGGGEKINSCLVTVFLVCK